jgi:hypothetical protein
VIVAQLQLSLLKARASARRTAREAHRVPRKFADTRGVFAHARENRDSLFVQLAHRQERSDAWETPMNARRERNVATLITPLLASITVNRHQRSRARAMIRTIGRFVEIQGEFPRIAFFRKRNSARDFPFSSRFLLFNYQF